MNSLTIRELRSRQYESDGAKVRTYDIVANSIINLSEGQRNAQADPDEAAAPAAFTSLTHDRRPPGGRSEF